MSAPELLVAFGRVGLLGFGGGPSTIPLLQAECVRYGFVTEAQFLEGLAIGNALPGPITTKMALYVGWNDAGWLGALAAFIGINGPSVVLMGLLSGLLIRHRDDPWVAGAMAGVKPAVVGMLFFVACDLAPTGVVSWAGALLAALSLIALVAKVHPAFVMVGAAVAGALWLRP